MDSDRFQDMLLDAFTLEDVQALYADTQVLQARYVIDVNRMDHRQRRGALRRLTWRRQLLRHFGFI